MYKHTARLLARQAEGADPAPAPACENPEAARDYWGLRIAAIFIILVTSTLGTLMPVYLARTTRMQVPKRCFFVAKYFGSGVILATAWMHLLSPASEALNDPCLANTLPKYDWAMGIGLMTVMVMFLVELIVSQYDWGSGQNSQDQASDFDHDDHNGRDHGQASDDKKLTTGGRTDEESRAGSMGSAAAKLVQPSAGPFSSSRVPGLPNDVSYPPGGENHMGHRRDHVDGDAWAAQMTGLLILEFGVIFHSVFIGLTLAVTEEFIVLFIVIVFHQTFEGLGLGARLATAKWPAGRKGWTPYIMGVLYGLTTPLAIAIGLGVNQSLALEGTTSKVVNGVFDAISGGILMYTALVELLAHEFLFSPEMRKAGLSVQLFAYGCVALGVALMALLAKWA